MSDGDDGISAMALTGNELLEAVGELRNARDQEQSRLRVIDKHWKDEVYGQAAGVYTPARATREYEMLVEQSRFNVLDLVVTAVAQNLFVDGYRPTGDTGKAADGSNAEIWDLVWQPNRMDARQSGIFRAAIGYGVSYATVLPGKPVPVITPMSPLKMTTLFEDPVNDEWPQLAMTASFPKRGGRRAEVLEVYDDQAVWTVELAGDLRSAKVIMVEEHGLEVTPVVRFLDRYDLSGSPGKIWPLIPIQRQLNQTTFSLSIAQQYSAFRQRWVTGMEIQQNEDGTPREPFNPAVNTMFQAVSPDTQFGEFGQTDLDGYLNSRQAALLQVASIAQIPPHNLLTGAGISNISADALAALESGHQQDIGEHQTCFGESIEQMLRLSGRAMGADGTWDDTAAEVVWRDTVPMSLSQSADALGKMASQLGIPSRGLWDRIPGVTEQELARWDALLSQTDLLDQLTAMVGNQAAEDPAEDLDAVTSG